MSPKRAYFEYESEIFVGHEAVNELVGAVLEELHRQREKWGVQSHSQALWYTILGEEFGEVGKAINEMALVGRGAAADLRTELVHVAAVALAQAEALERCGLDGGGT